MKDRIKRIFSNSNEKVDTFIVANDQHPNIDLNFFYITGITSGSFEHSYAIVKRSGEKILLTSQLEEPIARSETDFKVVTFNNKETRENQIKKLLSGTKLLGINYKGIIHKKAMEIKKLTKAKLVDMSESLAKARSIKDKKEIENISKACKFSSKVAEKIPQLIKPDISERELGGKITSLLVEKSNNTAFPTIAAFGRNSSRPHHSPTDNKLKRNEFVLADFGAEFNRYASDITRTFVFGKVNKIMKEMYETILDAQLQSIDMIQDGVNGKDVDKLARSIIDKKYKGRFIHSLGHEVGLSVHDGNRLSSQVDFILKEKMVVTVEPGVYIPSIGGVRIEDTILVTKGKPKVLTSSPK